MNHVTHGSIVSFIWGIADDVLRDVYVRGKYRDVILPMTVIRRLDALLDPTKRAVLTMKQQLDEAGIANQHAALCQAAGQSFYNTSPFTLRDLKARAKAQQLRADFEAYLDGFSPNVQEILDKFKFRNQIDTLVEADILGHLIEKLLDPTINLSPNPVLNPDGTERLPALDNHAMGTIFEELIRRFNEENNEEAGEHFTPRDVVTLMADLIFLPIADQIESGTYLVYDGACGTGGMLTVAEERLQQLAREHGKEGMSDPRFVVAHAGDPEYKMITRSSDGQLMFLVNKLAKMKHDTTLGSRIAEVHNGSALFTGDAGSGESNIRRWIIENDWLEAIVALPENLFYNTGIATYIWLLTNRKAPERRGKVQLIDATGWFEPLRKNLGKKNCRLGEEHIRRICDLINHPRETEQSKILPNEHFGYWKIIVERPLRLRVDLGGDRLVALNEACEQAKEPDLPRLILKLAEHFSTQPLMDYNAFIARAKSEAKAMGLRWTAKKEKLLREHLCETDEQAEPVIKKVHKPGKAGPDPLHGRFEMDVNGKPAVVEYEPDTQLRDSEQVPLLEEGGIEAFFQREVLPYVPDAWIDETKIQIGYEISFTREFYKPAPMRPLEAIVADIRALEQETEGLLDEILVEVER